MFKTLFKGITRLLVPKYRPRRAPSKMVAVVVPVSNRPHLLPEEEISLRHLQRFLGEYDKYLIVPKGMHFDIEGMKVIELAPTFFGSLRAHNQMLYSPGFFKLFEDYKYILLYHLDALVFSDELPAWCATDVDYIGAPWLPCADSPWVKEPQVGNGGFALYKVASALAALQNRYRQEPQQYWEERLLPLYTRLQPLLKRLRKPQKAGPGEKPAWLAAKLDRMDRAVAELPNSDLFYAMEAGKYFSNFKVADWRTGLRFAFEVAPRKCLEMNGGKMPFGCHAWARYDRSFWEPFLLPEGAATRETPGTLRRVAEPRAT